MIAAESAKNQNNKVVFLAEEFRIGADLKFTSNAQVLIFSNKQIDREDLLQYVGRGNRSGGNYNGVFYLLGKEKSEAASIEKRMKDRSEVKWEDAALILRTILVAAKTPGFSRDLDLLANNNSKGRWITNFTTFITRNSNVNKKFLVGIYDKLAKFND